MTHDSAEPVTFVVTDIETDGPSPLRNSMLSFASVAIDYEGNEFGTFEANLIPRADRTSDPDTMDWWQTEPEAWAAATTDPERPEDVMRSFVDWIRALPGHKAFVAAPILFDGPFMDHYLDTYAGERAIGGPTSRVKLFRGGGVCLYTMAGALRGLDYFRWNSKNSPPDWYGNVAHTHKAIDDARGYAHLLVKLFAMSDALPEIGAWEAGS